MPEPQPHQTPLCDWHQSHGARLVDFGGWSMPLHYGSIVEEHHAVRRDVGLFDISHMGRLTIRGPAAVDWIDRVATNDPRRLAPGQVQYGFLVNADGGVLDDILVTRLADDYEVVCNASNRARVVDHFRAQSPPGQAELIDRTLDTAMIAIQGPSAANVLDPGFEGSLTPLAYYHGTSGRIYGTPALVSRTGYTGEDGFEIVIAAEEAERVWSSLMNAGATSGIRPCGLGARDSLRLEAAMPLYGHELDESVNPYAAGLGWAVKLAHRHFVGRDALAHLKANPGRRRVGLVVEGKRIARQGYPVLRHGESVGRITSGSYSPTLGLSLAMAYVEPSLATNGLQLEVDIRGQITLAEVVPLPFYKRERIEPHTTTTPVA